MFGKKIKLLRTPGIFLLLVLLVNLSCQRDDICAESTLITPLLKISFFDNEADSDTIPKTVTNLRVRALGDTLSFIDRENTSEISIPLKTDVDLTTYEFILNARADNDTTSVENVDVINFTYARNREYINRACSFKVTYLDLRAIRQVETPAINNWIKRIEVEQPTVEDETTIHISIFH